MPNDLTGTKPADTYGHLLQIGAEVDSSLRPVTDGKGNSTPMSLSSSVVRIVGQNILQCPDGSTSVLVVKTSGGTTVLEVTADGNVLGNFTSVPNLQVRDGLSTLLKSVSDGNTLASSLKLSTTAAFVTGATTLKTTGSGVAPLTVQKADGSSVVTINGSGEATFAATTVPLVGAGGFSDNASTSTATFLLKNKTLIFPTDGYVEFRNSSPYIGGTGGGRLSMFDSDTFRLTNRTLSRYLNMQLGVLSLAGADGIISNGYTTIQSDLDADNNANTEMKLSSPKGFEFKHTTDVFDKQLIYFDSNHFTYGDGDQAFIRVGSEGLSIYGSYAPAEVQIWHDGTNARFRNMATGGGPDAAFIFNGNDDVPTYVIAGKFVGDGSLLTGIPTGDAALKSQANTFSALNTFNAGVFVSGNVSGTTFFGNGGGLTGLSAVSITGSHTLSDGVLSTNVPLLNASNTFTGTTTVSGANFTEIGTFIVRQSGGTAGTDEYQVSHNGTSGVFKNMNGSGGVNAPFSFVGSNNALTDVNAGKFIGNGSGLTNLNAGNISTGSLSDSRLSGNVALLDNRQTFSNGNSFLGNGFKVKNLAQDYANPDISSTYHITRTSPNIIWISAGGGTAGYLVLPGIVEVEDGEIYIIANNYSGGAFDIFEKDEITLVANLGGGDIGCIQSQNGVWVKLWKNVIWV